MADDETIAGTGEQAATQVSPAGTAPPEAATDLTGDAAIDGAAAVEQAPVTDDVPQSLDALWERFPTLREQYEAERHERENAGANRERARLQREAGRRDSVRQRTVQLAQRWDEMTPEERERDAGFTYTLAESNAAHELARALPQALLGQYAIPVEVRERALQLREDGVLVPDPNGGEPVRVPNVDGYVRELITAAIDAKDTERQREFDRKVTTEVNRRLAAEIRARGLEAAPKRDPMPAAPRGTSVRSGPTTQEYEAATPEQRKQWKREGVDPVLA